MFVSAAHTVKLEQYREDEHGPWARMALKFMKQFIFLNGKGFFFLERKKVGEVGGGKTIIRIYCRKKSIFNKRKKREKDINLS